MIAQARQLLTLVAPDKLKGSLSASEAATAMVRGVEQSGMRALACPLADGGEGTLEVYCAAQRGRFEQTAAADALGRERDARVGVLPDGSYVIEAASCLGLSQLQGTRDPMTATSRGLGLLLLHALNKTPPRVVIALGGTATMDGGAGMLQALGASLEGAPDLICARDLGRVGRVDLTPVRSQLKRTKLEVACDVSTKIDSAALVYGPQKGATPEQAEALQRDINRFAALLRVGAEHVDGGGAAGGLGAALFALGAQLQSGIDLVLSSVEFDEKLARADLVLTAEGQIDATSLEGKVLSGVAARAQRAQVPLIALTGNLQASRETLRQRGVTAAFAFQPHPASEAESRANASEWLESQAAAACQVFAAGFGIRHHSARRE